METTHLDAVRGLLPWLNGDQLSANEISERVRAFVVCSQRPWLQLVTHGDYPPSEKEWGALRDELWKLLADEALWDESAPLSLAALASFGAQATRPLRLRSLQFGVQRQRARPHKLSNATAAERRRIEGRGAFSLLVAGTPQDVLLFAIAYVLTEPGMVQLARCPARVPWGEERCGRLLVKTGRRGRGGQPATYCGPTCAMREHKRAKAREAADRKDGRKDRRS